MHVFLFFIQIVDKTGMIRFFFIGIKINFMRRNHYKKSVRNKETEKSCSKKGKSLGGIFEARTILQIFAPVPAGALNVII